MIKNIKEKWRSDMASFVMIERITEVRTHLWRDALLFTSRVKCRKRAGKSAEVEVREEPVSAYSGA